MRNDTLLLTTKGRVTGKDHTVPLLYLRDGRTLVVIASYGGRSDHPAWYHNLISQPRVMVQTGKNRYPMVARAADPEEREVWWPRALAAYDGYDQYQSRTDREIPVVLLEPGREG